MSAQVPQRSTVLLEVQALTKRFGSLVANHDVSLQLRGGEILALLGENGAGKSTLVSMLFGELRPDAGSVRIDGERLAPGDTRAALAAGLGMVHQHFTLAENLSVLDNVLVGMRAWWHLGSGAAQVRDRLKEASERYGLDIDPSAKVGDLSMGERQKVELLKALVRGARILILDEPTAVLTPQESESLFASLRRFVEQGLAIIFISHKLAEVLQVSDRVLVLRHGRMVLEAPTHGLTRTALAQAMVGASHKPLDPGAAPQTSVAEPPVVLELANVNAQRPGARHALQQISLRGHAGEILAIAGISGNGQNLLADLLFGLAAPSSGEVVLQGRPMKASAQHWVEASVARIPEDRTQAGVVGDFSLAQNAVLGRHRQATGIARVLGLLNAGAMKAQAQAISEAFDVRHSGLDQPIRRLSGGNIQKFILGRELQQSPGLIVAHQPTWGLDVGAVAFIHEQLRQAARRGACVLLISEDLDEVLALGHRVAVMFRGRLSAFASASSWSLESLGLAMAGALGEPHCEPA